MYSYRVVKCMEQKVSRWSGGSTTEICLIPWDGSYAERRFDWRLSTATVEQEESDFTSLPGIARHLMVLEGQIRLVHNSEREVSLVPFQEHCFEGGWATRSFGRCRDLNLMLAPGYAGALVPLYHGEKIAVRSTGETRDVAVGIYALKDNTAVTLHTEAGCETVTLDYGGFWLLTTVMSAGEDSVWMSVEIASEQQEVVAVLVRVKR